MPLEKEQKQGFECSSLSELCFVFDLVLILRLCDRDES